MNAYAQQPAAPAPPRQRIPDDVFAPDPRDWFRLVGGVLLAMGFIVMFARQEGEWGDFPLLLIVLLPALVLYGLGFLAGRREGASPLGWQAVFLILGTALGAASMAQLILLLGADNLDGQFEQSLVYFTIAGLAWVASFLRGVAVMTLVGGIAALFGWVALIGEIGSIDSADTYRTLILIYAALALAAAFAFGAAGRPHAPDFVSVAGASAIVAGLISLSGLAGVVSPIGRIQQDVPLPSEGWNVFILLVSVALIAYGTRARTRGPAYVGALGLLAFTGLTGSHVVALAHGDEGARPGAWPLVLIILGAIVAALGFLIRPGGIADLRNPTPQPPVQQPPAAQGWAPPPQPPPPPGPSMWAPPPSEQPTQSGFAPPPPQPPPAPQPRRDETAERERPDYPPPQPPG